MFIAVNPTAKVSSSARIGLAVTSLRAPDVGAGYIRAKAVSKSILVASRFGKAAGTASNVR